MKKLKVTVTIEYELDTHESVDYQQIVSDVVAEIKKYINNFEYKETFENTNSQEVYKRKSPPQKRTRKNRKQIRAKNTVKKTNLNVNQFPVKPDLVFKNINPPLIVEKNPLSYIETPRPFIRRKFLPRFVNDLESDLEPYNHSIKFFPIRGTALFDTS